MISKIVDLIKQFSKQKECLAYFYYVSTYDDLDNIMFPPRIQTFWGEFL